MARTFTCTRCGGTFPAGQRGPVRKRCAVRCTPKLTGRVPRRKRPVECRVCGVGFTSSGTRPWRCDACREAGFTGPVRACLWCGVGYRPRSWGNKGYCSAVCGLKARWDFDPDRPRGKGHKDRAAAYGVPYEPVDRTRVCERDGWVCQLCGELVDRELVWPHPWSASLDHVVPMSAGGAHSYENSQCSHLRCNIEKGGVRRAAV